MAIPTALRDRGLVAGDVRRLLRKILNNHLNRHISAG